MNKIAENIFTYDYRAKIMPGIYFPVRSTFIELENNGLMVISPGPFKAKFIQGIVAQYDVVYCVAPNAFHHLHLKHFYELFPSTIIYGPSILIKKQPWLLNKISELNLLADKLKNQVLFFPVLGSSLLQETVFYCCRSKSLILTDLVFNMRNPMPFGRKLILALVDAKNKVAQSKIIRSSIKDKVAYSKSVSPLGELQCKRIIVGHGNIIEGEVAIKQTIEEINFR